MQAAAWRIGSCRAIVLALAASAPAVHGTVIVVDPGSAADVALQNAIDAAADGDTLELLPGAWQWPLQAQDPVYLDVDGKSLDIVSAGEPRPVLIAGVIQNLPAGGRVVLRGIDFAPVLPDGNFLDFGVVHVENCKGTVWIEDCHAAAPPQGPATTIFDHSMPGQAGASVWDSADVCFVRCAFTGGTGAPANSLGLAQSGGAGLSLRNGSVAVHACTLKGAKCGTGMGGINLAGAPGLRAYNGANVLLAGGSAIGGDLQGNIVGAGVLVKDALSTVRVRDAVVQPGLGGSVAIDAPPGTVISFPAPARSLSIPCPLHAQQPTALTVDGVQGDLVAVFAASHGAMLFLPSHQGAFELAPPLLGPFVLGANPDPAGHWVLSIVAPDLPAGELGQTWLLQLVVNDGAHTLFEGGTSFVDLDASLP